MASCQAMSDTPSNSGAQGPLSARSVRAPASVTDSLVLAWELQGCQRAGTTPLWDACTVKLRGFSATDYLGEVSASGQVEARSQLSGRWPHWPVDSLEFVPRSRPGTWPGAAIQPLVV